MEGHSKYVVYYHSTYGSEGNRRLSYLDVINISQLQETTQEANKTRNSEKNLMHFPPGAVFIYPPLPSLQCTGP